MTEALLSAGGTALTRGHWDFARSIFEQAVEREQTPEALYGLAQALYWQGEYARSIDLHEQAYAGFRARGETKLPAQIAGLLAFEYASVYGNSAAANGWLERAKSLVGGDMDCAERGWVVIECFYNASDVDVKESHVRTAMDVARRIGDDDLHFCALSLMGACLVARGQVREGMRRLDEAVAAASCGEVASRLAIGEIYCKMLLAYEITVDVVRAEQWMSVAQAFVRRTNFMPISAICRMHYGGLLTAAGHWEEADEELTTSIHIYDRGYRALRAGAVVRLADLRVRQGRLGEAGQLLNGSKAIRTRFAHLPDCTSPAMRPVSPPPCSGASWPPPHCVPRSRPTNSPCRPRPRRARGDRRRPGAPARHWLRWRIEWEPRISAPLPRIPPAWLVRLRENRRRWGN